MHGCIAIKISSGETTKADSALSITIPPTSNIVCLINRNIKRPYSFTGDGLQGCQCCHVATNATARAQDTGVLEESGACTTSDPVVASRDSNPSRGNAHLVALDHLMHLVKGTTYLAILNSDDIKTEIVIL